MMPSPSEALCDTLSAIREYVSVTDGKSNERYVPRATCEWR
jgi:hypothetical protein